MIEIRFHGRGGQGAASGCTIFADAAFRGGKKVQAFPLFGVERRGAPVASFVRISETEIRARHNIYTPDHVFVLSESLMVTIDCTEGLKPGGTVTVNTSKTPEELGLEGDFTVYTVNATRIATKHGLGSATTPIVNTAMLGAAAKVTGQTDIELLMQCIREAAPSKPEENAKAARDTYDAVTL